MCSQPQAQQLAGRGRVVIVGVGVAGVQDPGIVEQPDVARLELHLQVERRIVGDPSSSSCASNCCAVSRGAC